MNSRIERRYHLGESIKRVLKERRSNQSRLSKHLGYTKGALCYMLATGRMKIEVVAKISLYLHYNFLKEYAEHYGIEDKC